jgi:membrane protein DedA with SNARE-associated domain
MILRERIILMFEWVSAYIEQFQYFAIALILFVAGLGVPIPEDIPLIYGGVMAGKGSLNVYIHFVVSMIFIIVGDVSLYFLGKRLSNSAHDRPDNSRLRKILTPERQAKVDKMFEKYGSWAVFFGRFIAGVRGAVFLSAGMAHFPLWKFVLFDFIAALISVPVWIALGYWAGGEWSHFSQLISTWFSQNTTLAYGIGIGLIVMIIALIMMIKNRKKAE